MHLKINYKIHEAKTESSKGRNKQISTTVDFNISLSVSSTRNRQKVYRIFKI